MKKYILFILFGIQFWSLKAQNIEVSTGIVFDGEPYLVVDPSNQQHLVSAWMGYQLNQKITIKTSYSLDGGSTWSTPIWQAHQVTGNSSADVSLGYDLNGNLYMSYIDYDNVSFSNGGIFVRRSTDGGQSWGNAVEAISVSDCPTQYCIDRPWIAVDKSGGINDGTVYVTSVNPDQPTLVVPPYHPYLAVSTDNGATFSSPRTLDTLGYYAGSTISQPMPSPIVSSNGTFMAIYPAYEPSSQGPFAHLYIAKSTTNGIDLFHTDAYSGTGNPIADPYVKKGSLFKGDPSNPNHIAYFTISEMDGDADVFFMESFDAGSNWSALQRINQDAVGNGKLQDLVWADFDLDGDLAVCWRDRRNGSTNTYQTSTEIYAAIRWKDSTNFSSDFPISDAPVAHDVVLEGNGNDFMNVNFLNDTLYAVWGDVRSGVLSVYLNKIGVHTGTNSIHLISQELTKESAIFPNPADDKIQLKNYFKSDHYYIYNAEGMEIVHGHKFPFAGLNIEQLNPGVYTLLLESGEWLQSHTFIKK